VTCNLSKHSKPSLPQNQNGIKPVSGKHTKLIIGISHHIGFNQYEYFLNFAFEV